MGLVDDDVLERELLQSGFLDQAQFVSGDANFEVLGKEPGGDDLGALIFASC